MQWRGKCSLAANILKGKDFLLFMLKYFCQETITGGWKGEEVPPTRQKAMSPGWHQTKRYQNRQEIRASYCACFEELTKRRAAAASVVHIYSSELAASVPFLPIRPAPVCITILRMLFRFLKGRRQNPD